MSIFHAKILIFVKLCNNKYGKMSLIAKKIVLLHPVKGYLYINKVKR